MIELILKIITAVIMVGIVAMVVGVLIVETRAEKIRNTRYELERPRSEKNGK